MSATFAAVNPEELTDAWLSDVLGHDVRVASQARVGDGLVGMNLRLAIDGPAGAPQSVVVKLPSPDPTSRATGIALRNYEREVQFYRHLADTLAIRVPHCFHADWDPDSGDFVLVLEDMAPARQGDQVVGCGAAVARTAVLELAGLHGPRWADPTLDEFEWLSRRTGPDDAAQLAMLWGMFEPGFLATYQRYLSVEAIELIRRFGTRVVEWVEGRSGHLTVVHGDFRLDNLLFASNGEGVPIVAVDWQTPGHSIGAGDISYFLGAGPLPELRRQIERPLVEEYCSALTEYGVDVQGSEVFQQYRREAFGGVVMSVIASQIVGESGRSEAMFAAMATRHAQHCLDLNSESLI